MKLDLSRHAPPGINLGSEKTAFFWGLGLSTCWSFSFLVSFSNAYSNLFEPKSFGSSETVLRDGAIMENFRKLLGSSLLGFAILAVVMLALVIYHYAYHRQGSKSIYLMRRLPKRFELHRRCWTLPIVSVLICAAAAFILLCIYYWIYMAITPDVCLMPGQWDMIWRL